MGRLRSTSNSPSPLTPNPCVERTGRDPIGLGSTLAAYYRRHDRDHAALADVLGCPLTSVPALALCARLEPRATHTIFALARKLGVDPIQVAAILRAVEPQPCGARR